MRGFVFSSRYSPTVFHAALKNGVDLYIEDSKAGKIRDNIPEWYWKFASAGSFILLPLTMGRERLASFTQITRGQRDEPERKAAQSDEGAAQTRSCWLFGQRLTARHPSGIPAGSPGNFSLLLLLLSLQAFGAAFLPFPCTLLAWL